jgi:hypothetical protein
MKTVKAIIIVVLVLIIVIPLIIRSINKRGNNEKDDNNSKFKKDIPVANKNQSTINGSNSSSGIKYEIETTIQINFTGEYGDIFDKIKPGDLVSFENSSEPYCVKNKVKEYCAQKGEDVGTQMPNSTNNGKLRFKSQNGNTGCVDVIFWKPK